VLQNSGAMAPSPYGGLYFADYDNGTIVEYHPHGVATTVAVPGKLDHPVGLTYLLGEVLVAEAGTKNDVGAIYSDGTVGLFSRVYEIEAASNGSTKISHKTTINAAASTEVTTLRDSHFQQPVEEGSPNVTPMNRDSSKTVTGFAMP